MHDGYEIRRGWCPISPELVKELAAIKTEPIFNDNPDHRSDRRRKQATLSTTWSRAIRCCLATKFPHHKPSPMVVIESLAGCQRQAAHCDYIPDEELLALPSEEMPLLFLLAIEPSTTLDLWPGSHLVIQGKRKSLCKRETIRLDPGDAILFRADLVHAGSAYEVPNRRVHLYLDHPEYRRDPNRTWIIYKHAPPSVKKWIDETG